MEFTLRNVESVRPVIDAAVGNRHVRRLRANGDIAEGTARSIGNDTGGFARNSEDVSECFLRVTMVSGWDEFWPVADLMEQVRSGEFVCD